MVGRSPSAALAVSENAGTRENTMQSTSSMLSSRFFMFFSSIHIWKDRSSHMQMRPDAYMPS